MTPSLEQVARIMQEYGVHCIVIGGWAAIIHGAARSTNAIDFVYARDAENAHRLVEALRPWKPYLRGAPPGLLFHWDEQTVRAGLNFTLTTRLGDLDLLGDVPGGGTYEKLLPYAETVTAFNVACQIVSLERLIQLKRASGRPKDLEIIAELQALLDERRKG